MVVVVSWPGAVESNPTKAAKIDDVEAIPRHCMRLPPAGKNEESRYSICVEPGS
jgi:hypothetical protein